MARKGTSAFGFVLVSLSALVLTGLLLAWAKGSAGLGPPWGAATVFAVDLVVVWGIVFGFGYVVTGSVSGIAINPLNQYSLSKLQMALWTIVVLAALFTSAKINLLEYYGPAGAEGALHIAIPTDIFQALGIAAFTTTATPAILALKSSQPKASATEMAATQKRMEDTTGGSASDATAQGRLVVRGDKDKAHWTDVLTGDEVSNAGTVDVSKVQQLLITVLLLGSYIFMMFDMLMHSAKPVASLPSVSEHFIGLLAISHAGYLAYKAAPKP